MPLDLDIAPGETLLTTLRNRCGLRGSKEACGVGECGSCTVLVDGRTTLSCITLTGRTAEVTTIEGLVDDESLNSITATLQEAFADEAAFQCGFCTPGQIVRGAFLLADGLPEGDHELRYAVSGNICRCTGYSAIISALRLAERELR